jgi:hypothetical protein
MLLGFHALSVHVDAGQDRPYSAPARHVPTSRTAMAEVRTAARARFDLMLLSPGVIDSNAGAW